MESPNSTLFWKPTSYTIFNNRESKTKIYYEQKET